MREVLDAQYIGMTVYPRKGSTFKPGKVISTKRCTLEGCTGTRLGVRWPHGRLTWPCAKGMESFRKGLRIL